ncbi:hypothetical protein EDB80DRAFT_723602 [Ilyonectria destructans]|nr:hypothetical protein EDB80DRAFT_723602 [Ilyonectria destructans]
MKDRRIDRWFIIVPSPLLVFFFCLLFFFPDILGRSHTTISVADINAHRPLNREKYQQVTYGSTSNTKTIETYPACSAHAQHRRRTTPTRTPGIQVERVLPRRRSGPPTRSTTPPSSRCLLAGYISPSSGTSICTNAVVLEL